MLQAWCDAMIVAPAKRHHNKFFEGAVEKSEVYSLSKISLIQGPLSRWNSRIFGIDLLCVAVEMHTCPASPAADRITFTSHLRTTLQPSHVPLSAGNPLHNSGFSPDLCCKLVSDGCGGGPYPGISPMISFLSFDRPVVLRWRPPMWRRNLGA